MTEAETGLVKQDIELISGYTNILLIAPHGHDKDDKNTGKLVRLIAEQSGSCAIINEFYRKPDADNPESKHNKRINLNELPQVTLYLKKEFLTPLYASEYCNGFFMKNISILLKPIEISIDFII